MNELLKIKALKDQFLNKINQLSMMQWVELADALGVARNDRNHAAKKLALRSLNSK